MLLSLCSGGELFDRLDQQGSLNEKDARLIFLQMVEAINYLHLLKIAHRDLKPENFLFLSKDSNNIKLIDFGLALRWDTSMKAELKQRNDRKIVGTVNYPSCSHTIWHLKSSTTIMMSDAISGHWESSSTFCSRLPRPSTEKMIKTSLSQSRQWSTPSTVPLNTYSPITQVR